MSKDKNKNNRKQTVRELLEIIDSNCARIGEIADTCERENRERTTAEEQEYTKLKRENDLLRMKVEAAQSRRESVPAMSADRFMRETLLQRGHKMNVQLTREGEPIEGGTFQVPQTTEALDGTGIISIHEQEMLKPVRKGLIYDKVGLTIRSGLSGTLRWPKHGKAVASFANEAERLTDSSIDWSKLEMSGVRMGIAVPVTREEIEESAGVVESVVREEMPKAILDLINSTLMSPEATYVDKEGKTRDRKVMGPFVAAAASAHQFAGELPTRKELLAMVTAVAEKLDLEAPCWVMTEAMKAQLRDVKVDAGSGRFLCENDVILGYPVFTTQEIGAGNIGFGDWSYQAAGFFGAASIVADPYTLARQNSVDFVLNHHFGTVTLREDAFVLGKVKGA